MRYTRNELKHKRGRKQTVGTNVNANVSANLALVCAFDDTLMIPVLEPKDPTGRVSKRNLLYLCPHCGNTINPKVEAVEHAMLVQTPDNAIEYNNKKSRTIASNKMKRTTTKPDELKKFIEDPYPPFSNMWVNVTKRTIERRGAKQFKQALPT